VILRISPARQVAQNAPISFGGNTRIAPLQAKLRLAHPGGARQHGQRPRQQSATERFIERFNPKPLSHFRHELLSTDWWTTHKKRTRLHKFPSSYQTIHSIPRSTISIPHFPPPKLKTFRSECRVKPQEQHHPTIRQDR
jgi:hypothetical protein